MRNSAEFSYAKAPKSTHYNVNYCLHRVGVVEAASSSLVTQTKKALETLRFPMLFSYPVTQFFGDCYTNCYAADGQLPTTNALAAQRKTDRQLSLVAQPWHQGDTFGTASGSATQGSRNCYTFLLHVPRVIWGFRSASADRLLCYTHRFYVNMAPPLRGVRLDGTRLEVADSATYGKCRWIKTKHKEKKGIGNIRFFSTLFCFVAQIFEKLPRNSLRRSCELFVNYVVMGLAKRK